MDIRTIDMEIGGRKLYVETGRVARQADASIWIRYADTIALISIVVNKNDNKELRSFFPLTVDYREKTYAAGKIPGGFFKREGRPREKETLAARLIDRPLRPLFPNGFSREVQISVNVLSSDMENDGDVLGVIGSSIALNMSCIPFDELVSAVHVGRLGGNFIINPTFSQAPYSDINIVVTGTDDAITMVEGEMREVSEEDMFEALSFAHEEIRKINLMQREFLKGFNPIKIEYTNQFDNYPDLSKRILEWLDGVFPPVLTIPGKTERKEAFNKILRKGEELFKDEHPDIGALVHHFTEQKQHELVRRMLIEEKKRIGGRGFDDIREIDIRVGVLPRAHGSAIFTRGETQALVVTTLGTVSDRQLIDDLEGESWKSYMLHYNFPLFSVGETGPNRGPGRREIGHGNLAERSLSAVIPAEEIFPYTIRIVSEILESNGSSSMATVCGASMALMDAGVPIKAPVAGVSIGLIKEDASYLLLIDIMGEEDHHGDMDFKIAGTEHGFTGIQIDIKIKGLNLDIIKDALSKGRQAHLKLLEIMKSVLEKPREDLSVYAPSIISFDIDQSRIGEVIGQGGRIIKGIIEETGADINIEDEGKITISSMNKENNLRAKEIIEGILAVPEIGKIYMGKVKKVATFGVFVEFLPGQEGLVHISQLSETRINKPEDVAQLGDELLVKVIKVDEQNRVSLSHKEAVRDKQESE